MPEIIQGNIVDILARNIYFGELHLAEGRITRIRMLSDGINTAAPYITPGFVDAHVHIESSMLVPSSFARLAVVHGTVATVSDPHEIANVCGEEGIEFMIANGRTVPFKFHFGAPSCVPATKFETAGAELDAAAVRRLLERDDIYYLSEMMNFPGVLNGDTEVMEKIAAAKTLDKPVDGHAPGLRGEDAHRYIAAGISTDHECFTPGEALDKLQHGMKILIREGSAAKNFDALIGLLEKYPEQIMFCTDDKHPDSLVAGHIDQLCARAIEKEIDLFNILRAACINPVLHYRMNVGLLREGDPADFILMEELEHFDVLETWVNGQLVARNGQSLIPHQDTSTVNRFSREPLNADAFRMPATREPQPAIEALNGQLITNRIPITSNDLNVENGFYLSNPKMDLLKICVVNRYGQAPVALGFVKNFGLKKGAIASSVAHDSHNIIAVGVDDISLCAAVNLVIREKGGISCVCPDKEAVLSLPVAGLMSNDDGYEVAKAYTEIDSMAKDLGSTLAAPFMTLSFMALLVIPELKLSDKGLFNGATFGFEQ
ncbi:adenine deaminase [Flavihumibacter solisilvae]|uniref:Adenine deaminase n=1 Tax=Flavihumibacter solisilvae TaxID=1349421 RepID=A0A0C1L705_9BACT|nr:adenine deaminase [Flavihumibacter solisilvae]KIC95296.1 adenine deaminase [Flavihumibacter solisilvae]